jgi:hypothetical protein
MSVSSNFQSFSIFATEQYTGVPGKIFEPNISVICQRIFMKFKIHTDILDGEGSISNNKITSC